jgi:hypothetical protein
LLGSVHPSPPLPRWATAFRLVIPSAAEGPAVPLSPKPMLSPAILSATSVYMITLTKPDAMPMEAFEGGMNLMDDELTALKARIEAL